MNPLIYQIYGPGIGPRRGDLDPKSMCLGSMKMVKWHCLNWFLLQRRVAEYELRNFIREYYRQKLIAKPDQGKVYEITSATIPPNNFLQNGDFTRFADWRIIHRARLDCVPLNGSQRFGNKNRKCRRCGYANETLPHVLCHCKPNLVAINSVIMPFKTD